jgi:thymidylate synthase
VYPNFQDAYLAELDTTFNEPEYRNAPRGFPSRERLGVSFTIADAVQRHVTLPARRANPIFCFAEALWYLAGTNDLSFISYYAPGIKRYSADGRTLQGTAYGPRIFRYPRVDLDQWARIGTVLREDPDSKRAVIQIFDPFELRESSNIDVACTLALQFLIRDGALCVVGFMRANDAFRGMVSDVFSFTVLQELMARQLGVPVGTYHHQVGSMHVYDSDIEWASKVLAEAASRPAGQPELPFPAMPDGDNWPHVRAVLGWERALRLGEAGLSADQLRALDLPDYWRHVVALFELQRRIPRLGKRPCPDVVELLPAVLRDSVIHRWPHLQI